MARGRIRLTGLVHKPRNPTEEGVGEALRTAFRIDEGDAAEVRRMEELIVRMKRIEGIDD